MLNTVKVPQRTKSHRDMLRSDGELFQSYCQGDQKAFEELFTRHKSPLYAYCLRMIGEKDRAGDAFQDTFLRVIKYRDSYRPEKEFSSWLFAIARNVCRTLLSGEDTFLDLDDVADEVVAPEPSLDFSERQSIADALQQLPPALREAVILYEYENLSYQEIAEITQVSLSLVKIRIHRARKALRVMLKPVFRDVRNTL